MITTIEDIKKIRQIAENIQDIRIEPYIEQTEELVIIPAIGIELYREIESDISAHIDILWPKDYEVEECGRMVKKYSPGLIKAISYIAYSKMLLNQQISVTAFGVRTMNSQYSDKAEERDIVRASNEARAVGDTYLSQTLEYINKGTTTIQKKKRRFIAI